MEGIKLNILTSDGDVFPITAKQAQRSEMLKTMINALNITDANDTRLEEPMLLNVSTAAFEKIAAWLKEVQDKKPRRKNFDDPRITLTAQEKEFCEVEADLLIEAANFLDIGELVDIISQFIADLATGKCVEELRELFEIENDFTPEEEEELRKRFEWIEADE